jgi:protein-S-isoprenylcysteine O-methyltransferase Ste14
MKTELKKLLLFGVIISFSTSVYVSFINTVVKQGFGTSQFIRHWLMLIPKTYLLVLPFVLITGPLIRKLVDYIFRKSEGKDISANIPQSSKNFAATNSPNEKDNAGVIIFPPLLFLIAIAVGLAIRYTSGMHFMPYSIEILGWIPVSTGLIILLLAVNLFSKNHTTINPSGTSTTIVSSGIYKYTRNPMYLSFALIYAGIMIINQAGIGLLLLIPLLVIVRKGIIDREEIYLSKKFGSAYTEYKLKVRRWI